jgi:uncharacterized membrane protein
MKRLDGLAIGVIGATAALTAIVYERLPERLATHFDIHGNPNGWMSRAVGAWFMPVFALAIWALVRFATRRVEPGRASLLAMLVATFMSAVHVLVLGYALVPGMGIMRPLWGAVGLLYVALALILPRVKRNAFVGVRTPWTLRSDENWARTQRVAGYAMFAGGILVIACGVVGGGTSANIVALVAIFVSALVPVIYSLVIARRLSRG